jgi:hypothetical protein
MFPLIVYSFKEKAMSQQYLPIPNHHQLGKSQQQVFLSYGMKNTVAFLWALHLYLATEVFLCL